MAVILSKICPIDVTNSKLFDDSNQGTQLKPTIRVIKPRRWLQPIVLGLFSVLINTISVTAADRIYFIYNPIRLSLRIESLELFAEEGKVNQDLGFYLSRIGTSAQEREVFRNALVKKAQVDPVLLSRLFNTNIGEAILKDFGQVITIQGGRNGKYALRGAIIQAAFEPEGLTLINVLRKLPVNMQIDIREAIALSQAVEAVVAATTEFTTKIARLSQQEAQATPTVNFSSMPDLRQPGSYGVQELEIWNLFDRSRNRRFYANVYKPQRWQPGKTPVVIFSHGLASRPEDFSRQAQHLASYGYVVVLPNHPGSNLEQVQSLIAGFTRDIFVLNEFIDRPKDITYIIDELERRNQSEFDGQLNLDAVGVAGHSFGGYAALAVAGATLDFDYLQEECDQRYSFLNVSLLLQCRALDLPRTEYNFRDKRVKAVFLENPVNSGIFGPQGLAKIDVPVFLGAGTYDPATPVIFEQARSFPWLSVPNKYLLVIEGQAHVDFSQVDAGITKLIESAEKLTLPSPYLINNYTNAMFTAFFGTHLQNNPDFLPYLQAIYSAYLSNEEPFKCHLITAASSEELGQEIDKFRARNPFFR